MTSHTQFILIPPELLFFSKMNYCYFISAKDIYILNNVLGGSVGKEFACNAGDIRDTSLIPESGRSSRGRSGNPLQFLAWESPWTEEPSRLQSMVSQELDMTQQLTHTCTHKQVPNQGGQSDLVNGRFAIKHIKGISATSALTSYFLAGVGELCCQILILKISNHYVNPLNFKCPQLQES